MGCDGPVITSTVQARQKMFTDIVNHSNGIYCQFKPDTTLTFVNDAYCNTFNLSREQLIGKKFLDLVPQNHHQEIKDHLSQLNHFNPSIYYDHTALDINGSLTWQAWEDHAIFDDNNNIVEIESIGRDYIRQEDNCSKLNLVRMDSKHPELVIDKDTFQIECTNNKAVEFYGCSREYLESTHALEWSNLTREQVNQLKLTPAMIDQFSFRSQHTTYNNFVYNFKVFASHIHTHNKSFLHLQYYNISLVSSPEVGQVSSSQFAS